MSVYTTITASLPFIEVDLNLSPQEMSMFNNGLKYVIPCQSQFSSKSIEQLVSEQYQKKRAKHEYKIVQSIRHLLRDRSDIVIRRTDKSKVFYIGKATDFARKSEEYMLKTKAYQEITSGRCPLSDMLYAVQTLLSSLVTQKALSFQQYSKISPRLNKLELGHYHGLPKPHKPGTRLRPIIACIHAPATLVSKFLNDLLVPIYLNVAREITFINGIDTMIPREGALHALMRFLEKNSHHGKVGTLSIDAIMRMARLILDTNCFAYNNKYYQQTRGGAMGSAFTQVLANIYMFEWEQDLIKHQTVHKAMYGRYIDDIFMTTNRIIDEIKTELEEAANKDINIKIHYEIDT
ncbi:unnamed protein product [Rotaria sordida]|uniref:Reverse transcriptase domain-containing protein n=1 Tax=Rotaria sordida TaxID=392033 RepID=A0A814XVF8_9BILA|nr:unnamed protein product [Rotaria sordida]CAF1220812.1 unnamed protein product [Rotaria sordida]